MISIIIPVYNEEKNIQLLYRALKEQCKKLSLKYELLFVDDGSSDNSFREIRKLTHSNKSVKFFQHRKRSGKGRALQTGLDASRGSVIVFIDADLQNDPRDLGKFLQKIHEGYDVVNGYRKKRKDAIYKTLPSKIYNRVIIPLLFKTKLHDINCGFKAIRREVFKSIQLYGDNYRILPLLAQHEGYRVTEIEITHHRRRFGVSKFGFWRMFFGFFDVLGLFFLLHFVEKPLHFFGALGSFLLSCGVLVLLYLGLLRIVYGYLLYRRPILFLGMLLVIVGVQIIATGFIGELMVYLHKNHESDSRPHHR